jgi:hypothetical protein
MNRADVLDIILCLYICKVALRKKTLLTDGASRPVFPPPFFLMECFSELIDLSVICRMVIIKVRKIAPKGALF